MKRLAMVNPRTPPPPTDADKYLGPSPAAAGGTPVVVEAEPAGGSVVAAPRRDIEGSAEGSSPAPLDKDLVATAHERVPSAVTIRRSSRPEGVRTKRHEAPVAEETWPTPIHLSAHELELLDNERSRRQRVPRVQRKNKEKLTRSSLVREAIRAYFGGGQR